MSDIATPVVGVKPDDLTVLADDIGTTATPALGSFSSTRSTPSGAGGRAISVAGVKIWSRPKTSCRTTLIARC